MAHSEQQTKKLTGQPENVSYSVSSSTHGLAPTGIPGSIGGITQESLVHGNDTVDYAGRVPRGSSIAVAGSTGPAYPERLWAAYEGSMRGPLQPYDEYIDKQQQGFSMLGSSSYASGKPGTAPPSSLSSRSNEAGEQTATLATSHGTLGSDHDTLQNF